MIELEELEGLGGGGGMHRTEELSQGKGAGNLGA